MKNVYCNPSAYGLGLASRAVISNQEGGRQRVHDSRAFNAIRAKYGAAKKFKLLPFLICVETFQSCTRVYTGLKSNSFKTGRKTDNEAATCII